VSPTISTQRYSRRSLASSPAHRARRLSALRAFRSRHNRRRHASNVFHFLTGNQLDAGLRAISNWLCSRGRLFVQTSTPYQAPFTAFIPEYERRLAAGVKWPGWLAKAAQFSTHRQLGQMPRSIHLLDDVMPVAQRQRKVPP
jgi:hypothetical protein